MRTRLAVAVLVVGVLAVLVVLVPRQPAPPSTTAARAASPTPTATPAPPPGWVLGAQVLPRRTDGYGQVLPTPPELRDRRLPTRDLLPPPTSDRYTSSISAVPADVLARSTWRPGCPVGPERLRYLQMSFRGFDGRAHTGEMIVRDDVADDVVGVFGRLFDARFPIEEMRVVTPADLAAPPTGDGNNTSAFVCRPAVGQTRFSAHASGLAIDLDPFQNPYERADGLVLPELASAYTDRGQVRPGMLRAGDVAVRAFTGIGWTWGATFSAPKDPMHFSATGD